MRAYESHKRFRGKAKRDWLFWPCVLSRATGRHTEGLKLKYWKYISFNFALYLGYDNQIFKTFFDEAH